MNDVRAGKEDAVAKAVDELARLREETELVRAELLGLQQQLAETKHQLDNNHSAQLLEANEQLVFTTLLAQSDLETAAQALEDVSRSAEHERRHAQQQEANQQLVLAAIGAQELQAAAELAQQRQTDFLGMLAHELRNPLAPISTAAALLGRVSAEDLPGMQAIIERQVAHMSRLVSDLLDVARVNTGKLRLERRTVDIVGIAGNAAAACRPAMEARAQRFHVQLPPSTLEVDGDPVRLAQVLGNLLDNASKYIPGGGEIALTAEVAEGMLVMTVSDNGIGITAEALPHVFDPFVQEPHATGFNGAGLGIGLTVVRELVEAHGGNVVASSAGSGLGSRFVVTLPLSGSPFEKGG